MTPSCSRWRRTSRRLGGALGLVLGLLTVGCVSPGVESSFAVRPDQAYAAAEWVLTSPDQLACTIRSSSPEEGKITTQWQDGVSEKTQGLLFPASYNVRSRYIVRVSPGENEGWSQVWVNVHLEEHPPAGSRAYRWKRVPGGEEPARKFLVRVGQYLRRSGAISGTAEGEKP